MSTNIVNANLIVNGTVTQNQLPRFNIVRSGVFQVPLITADGASTMYLNFISGFAVQLDFSVYPQAGGLFYLQNTGLGGAVSLSILQGGTIGGLQTYSLPQGNGTNPPLFNWDGTNLNLVD